jgi:hypothetical protein
MRHSLLGVTAALVLLGALAGCSPPQPEPPRFASDAGSPPDPCQDGAGVDGGYLTSVHDQLQLTASQEPLWNAWQQKVQAAAQAQQARCQQASQRGLTVLQHQDMDLSMASARVASLQASRPDLERLYGALTPAQRDALNQLWPPRPPMNTQQGGLPGGSPPPNGQLPGLP